MHDEDRKILLTITFNNSCKLHKGEFYSFRNIKQYSMHFPTEMYIIQHIYTETSSPPALHIISNIPILCWSCKPIEIPVPPIQAGLHGYCLLIWWYFMMMVSISVRVCYTYIKSIIKYEYVGHTLSTKNNSYLMGELISSGNAVWYTFTAH